MRFDKIFQTLGHFRYRRQSVGAKGLPQFLRLRFARSLFPQPDQPFANMIYELRSETFSDTLRGPLAFFFGQTEG
jgi:hypothetical protein